MTSLTASQILALVSKVGKTFHLELSSRIYINRWEQLPNNGKFKAASFRVITVEFCQESGISLYLAPDGKDWDWGDTVSINDFSPESRQFLLGYIF